MVDGGDVITRKEYEERHTAIQIQLTEITQLTRTNSETISHLEKIIDENGKQVRDLMISVSIQRDRAKWLYPLVGIMGSLITFLMGLLIASGFHV